MRRKLPSREEYEALLKEKMIRQCRKDPNQFIQYIMSFGIPGWIKQCDLHIKWQNTITNGGRKILLVTPRDHSKSTQAIGRAMWELGNNHNLRIKFICQGDDIAIKRLTAIMDHIDKNPRLKEIFPDLIPSAKGEWSKTKIYVNRDLISPDPSIEAVGILSTGTGGRGDLLIFDDPVDFRNAIQQPALREVVKEAYKNVWMNVLEETGRVLYLATPFHKDDLTHELMIDPTYTKVLDKIDDDLTPIWPEKWSKERLQERFQEIGTRAFSRAFKMEALSEDETLFPESVIERCINKDFEYGELPVTVSKKDKDVFIGVDIGGGRSESGSYTVIFTGAIVGNTKIPLNITRGRFKSPEFAKIFFNIIETFNPTLAIVENNAVQEAIIQWVQETYGRSIMIPIKGYFTGSQKMKDDVGLPAMAVEFEQKSWELPNKHKDGCSCGYCVWLSELRDFPLGKYSDTVMASWLFREAIRLYRGKEPNIRVFSLDEPKDRARVATAGVPISRLDSLVYEMMKDEDDEEFI